MQASISNGNIPPNTSISNGKTNKKQKYTTITISKEVYNQLLKYKKEDESFTSLIRRILTEYEALQKHNPTFEAMYNEFQNLQKVIYKYFTVKRGKEFLPFSEQTRLVFELIRVTRNERKRCTICKHDLKPKFAVIDNRNELYALVYICDQPYHLKHQLYVYYIKNRIIVTQEIRNILITNGFIDIINDKTYREWLEKKKRSVEVAGRPKEIAI